MRLEAFGPHFSFQPFEIYIAHLPKGLVDRTPGDHYSGLSVKILTIIIAAYPAFDCFTGDFYSPDSTAFSVCRYDQYGSFRSLYFDSNILCAVYQRYHAASYNQQRSHMINYKSHRSVEYAPGC